jgi:opacity protein-like surface antigen
MRLSEFFAALVVAAVIFPGVAPASAQEDTEWGVYLRADAGWSFMTWSEGSDDSAFAGGGGIGYQFNEYFRSDLRVDWTGNYDFDFCCWYTEHFDFITTTGNVYVDIPTGVGVTPYLGAGLGYASANKESGFTLAGMAGLAVEITESVDLDVGFRFLNISADPADIQAYQWFAGVRFGF